MGTAELVALILQGGAVVVLFLWNRDLQDQRKAEREERIKNAEVMQTVGSALGELTTEIGPLVEIVPELVEAMGVQPRTASRERRR